MVATAAQPSTSRTMAIPLLDSNANATIKVSVKVPRLEPKKEETVSLGVPDEKVGRNTKPVGLRTCLLNRRQSDVDPEDFIAMASKKQGESAGPTPHIQN